MKDRHDLADSKAMRSGRALSELSHAMRFQQRILPKPIHDESLEFAIDSRSNEFVGGDYVDIIPLGDGDSSLICVADVCGKGYSAALMAAGVRMAVRSLLVHGSNTAALIGDLNRLIIRSYPAGGFITLFAGVVDRRSRKMRFANAGHCPPLVIDPDGEWQLIQQRADSLPLGIDDELDLSEQSIDLAEDRLVVLYTDGCTDLETPEGLGLGVQGFAEMIASVYRRQPRRDVSEMLSEVARRLYGSHPNAIRDDCTIALFRMSQRDTPAATMHFG